MKFTNGGVAFLIILPSQAYAYLDPGTGSIILQAIIAGIVSLLVAFSAIKVKVSSFLKKLFPSRGAKPKSPDE